METISELIRKNAREGTVAWIGIRPARRAEMTEFQSLQLNRSGFEGDHYQSGGKRTVSLIQAEHLNVIAELLGKSSISPQNLRRNLVVSGINLLGLRNRQFIIGNVLLEGTGLCAPCSRMEETLGHGGYSAVRGHGGIVARVLEAGRITVGDPVCPVDTK